MLLENEEQNQSNTTFQGLGKLTFSNKLGRMRAVIEDGLETFDESLLKGADLVVIKGGELEKDIKSKYVLLKKSIKHENIESEFAHISNVMEWQPAGAIKTARSLVSINSNLINDIEVGKNAIFNKTIKHQGKTKIHGDFSNKNESEVSKVHVLGNASNISSNMDVCFVDGDFTNKIASSNPYVNDSTTRELAISSGTENVETNTSNPYSAEAFKVCIKGNAQNLGGVMMGCQMEKDFINALGGKTFSNCVYGNAHNNGSSEMHGDIVHKILTSSNRAKTFDVQVATGNAIYLGHSEAHNPIVSQGKLQFHDKAKLFGEVKGTIVVMDPKVEVAADTIFDHKAATSPSFVKYMEIKRHGDPFKTLKPVMAF